MGGLRVSASRLKVKESSGLRRTAAEGDNEDDSIKSGLIANSMDVRK